MIFRKPADCKITRDRRNTPSLKAKGEKNQVRCAACMRWCYIADRCNLFDPLPGRGSSSARAEDK